jgi:hypothetical protein
MRESLSGIHDMAIGALTLNCEKHHSRMLFLRLRRADSSDDTEKDLDVFKAVFTADEVEMLRRDMDVLTKWDEEYFSQRKTLLKELNDLVVSVADTGILLLTPIYSRCGRVSCESGGSVDIG